MFEDDWLGSRGTKGWNNELLGSLKLSSLKLGSLNLMIDKARIVMLVKDNDLKSLFGLARYVSASAHELLIKIAKKILLKPIDILIHQ
jgi:hypothetical protein